MNAKRTRIVILMRNAKEENVSVKENTSEMGKTAEVIIIITLASSQKKAIINK